MTYTIAEYLKYYQPATAALLGAMALPARKTEEHPFSWWKQLMQERPLPGRAGGVA